MKGDEIEVVYQVGDSSEKILMQALENGHSVRYTRARDKITVEVVDRNENVKRTVEFRPDVVLAILERPNPNNKT